MKTQNEQDIDKLAVGLFDAWWGGAGFAPPAPWLTWSERDQAGWRAAARYAIVFPNLEDDEDPHKGLTASISASCPHCGATVLGEGEKNTCAELDASDIEPGPRRYRVTNPHGHPALKSGHTVMLVIGPNSDYWLMRTDIMTLHEIADGEGQYVHLVEIKETP